MPEDIRAASNKHHDDVCEEINPDSTHLTFTQKSKCGGRWWESHHEAILVKKKNDVSSTLLKKGKEKIGSLAQWTINDGSFTEGKSVVISYLIL
jgi:hypothetical protein